MNNQFDELTKKETQPLTRPDALKKFSAVASTTLAFFVLITQSNASPSFTTIDYPGAVLTAADDINASGQVCGWYIDVSGVFHGFLLSGGAYASITFPGAGHTSALG